MDGWLCYQCGDQVGWLGSCARAIREGREKLCGVSVNVKSDAETFKIWMIFAIFKKFHERFTPSHVLNFFIFVKFFEKLVWFWSKVFWWLIQSPMFLYLTLDGNACGWSRPQKFKRGWEIPLSGKMMMMMIYCSMTHVVVSQFCGTWFCSGEKAINKCWWSSTSRLSSSWWTDRERGRVSWWQ